MAYDKIIDSQKLENDLSLLADKIREKTKTEEQLVFPEEYISSPGGSGREDRTSGRCSDS